jgi:choline dehydrogenase-like flavoprotein
LARSGQVVTLDGKPSFAGPTLRTLERLTDVVCPAEGSRAARRPTLEKLELYAARLPPSTRRTLAAALVALDHGARLYPPARGRRFSQLPVETAERYFGSLLNGRLGPVSLVANVLRSAIALCHYDVPEVRARVGYQPEPHIAALARRRLERHGEAIRRVEEAITADTDPSASAGARPAGLVTEDDVERTAVFECGAVVVGSGAGGATMASELADAGIDVTLVEEGGYHPTESFGTDVVEALGALYRSGGTQTIVGRTPIAFLEGRCVGGSTTVNGGMCWQTPSDVLERWSRVERLTAIAPHEMERHFEKAEQQLSVGPQEASSIGADAALLRQGAEALDWDLATSQRNQLYCAGCDNCFCGCPTGAKRSMLVTSVRRALVGGARLVAGCRVDRITRSGGAVSGVEGHFVRPDGSRGGKLTVRAPVVVIACGAIQTPALLARSRLHTPSGMLGRNLTIHPGAALLAIFDHEVRGWEGVHQAYQVTQFIRDGILVSASTLPPALVASSLPQSGTALHAIMRDYNRMVVAGCLVEDRGVGRVRMIPGVGPVAHYELGAVDAARVVHGLSKAAEVMLAAGAPRVILPIAGAPAPIETERALRFLSEPISARALRPFTVHAMGTARMSERTGEGVVSSFGEVHGTPGIFVADASILPGPVGVNPMETIIALALRNSERLIGERASFGI